MTDSINPMHYKKSDAICPCGRTIECIDVVKVRCFRIGNVIKYLWRAGLKNNSSELEDYKKAAWYLNNKIEDLENGKNKK